MTVVVKIVKCFRLIRLNTFPNFLRLSIRNSSKPTKLNKKTLLHIVIETRARIGHISSLCPLDGQRCDANGMRNICDANICEFVKCLCVHSLALMTKMSVRADESSNARFFFPFFLQLASVYSPLYYSVPV